MEVGRTGQGEGSQSWLRLPGQVALKQARFTRCVWWGGSPGPEALRLWEQFPPWACGIA